MLKHLTIRTKLMAIVATVTLVFGATVYRLDQTAKLQVVQSLQKEMERTEQITAEYYRSRFKQLDAGLSSLVDSPEIRAVLTTEGIDFDTQLMSIVDLQHLLNADAVLYCNEAGKTLARTDDPFDHESYVGDIGILKNALKGETTEGLWELDDAPLLAIAYPVTIDEEVRGVVLAGVDLSQDAIALKPLLLQDISLAKHDQQLSSSLSEQPEELGELDFAAVNDISDVERLPRTQILDPSHSQARIDALAVTVPVGLTSDTQLRATVFVPLDTIYGFYHSFRSVLMIVGFIAFATCLGITLRISSIISSNVRETLEVLQAVASGDLKQTLSIDSRDEFGRIAKSLNAAIAASDQTLSALEKRNRDTQTLLDSVEQGFFTIDVQGIMSDERSGAVERCFGPTPSGTSLVEFIRQFDSSAAEWIELGLEDVFCQIMPLEVTLDQLPKRFKNGNRDYSIEYSPILVEEELTGLAVVISDVSAEVQKERLEAQQRQMLSMVHRMAEDRNGFLEFFDESSSIVEELRSNRENIVLAKRQIHTLKGNTAIFELQRFSELCHHIEDYIAEHDTLPELYYWDELFQAWDAITSQLASIRGDRAEAIEIPNDEFESLLQLALNSNASELAQELSKHKLEPTAIRLQRVGEQAASLARRLGKGEINVRIDDHSLRTDAAHWAPFWSAFIHVIRNAIDHGLETPETRENLGKPSSGTLLVTTQIVGDEFVVAVRDDGSGICWESVMEAAYKRGLPGETREELIDALFADGLSTASQVTSTSGRGVGLAAIKQECAERRGRISVETEPGRFTEFKFTFPVKEMAPASIEQLSSQKIPTGTLLSSAT